MEGVEGGVGALATGTGVAAGADGVVVGAPGRAATDGDGPDAALDGVPVASVDGGRTPDGTLVATGADTPVARTTSPGDDEVTPPTSPAATGMVVATTTSTGADGSRSGEDSVDVVVAATSIGCGVR